MMEAETLAPEVWNAINERVERQGATHETTFGRVIKRDVANRVIWLAEFGDTGIPLVSFGFQFDYYDTNETGAVAKRLNNEVKMQVPRVGQMVAILNPWGTGRFPMCVGVLQSEPGMYWQGE